MYWSNSKEGSCDYKLFPNKLSSYCKFPNEFLFNQLSIFVVFFFDILYIDFCNYNFEYSKLNT